jgi:hypothetical protein
MVRATGRLEKFGCREGREVQAADLLPAAADPVAVDLGAAGLEVADRAGVARADLADLVVPADPVDVRHGRDVPARWLLATIAAILGINT